jgi:hypothetical protein
MNRGAPQSNLPSWSADTSALDAHVSAYWVSMGVASCQVNGVTDSYGSAGAIPKLSRGFDGIAVADSLAVAHFDVDDQTTEEDLYWPEIPGDVVSSAVAFKNDLATPTGLAAYKAKLPANAQGKGQVVIHHTSEYSFSPFTAQATYDVTDSTPHDEGDSLSFDENGQPVTTQW